MKRNNQCKRVDRVCEVCGKEFSVYGKKSPRKRCYHCRPKCHHRHTFPKSKGMRLTGHVQDDARRMLQRVSRTFCLIKKESPEVAEAKKAAAQKEVAA